MKHGRSDYDRIQDPATNDPTLARGGTPIGEDEPVFVLRAKDVLAPIAVAAYGRLLKNHGKEADAKRVAAWADEMLDWQDQNGCKLPDAPAERLA